MSLVFCFSIVIHFFFIFLHPSFYFIFFFFFHSSISHLSFFLGSDTKWPRKVYLSSHGKATKASTKFRLIFLPPSKRIKSRVTAPVQYITFRTGLRLQSRLELLLLPNIFQGQSNPCDPVQYLKERVSFSAKYTRFRAY